MKTNYYSSRVPPNSSFDGARTLGYILEFNLLEEDYIRDYTNYCNSVNYRHLVMSHSLTQF